MKVLTNKKTRMRGRPLENRRRAGVAGLVERRLRETAYWDLRHVTCEFRDGVAILSGRVPTFYLKQVAQTIVGKLEPVDTVVNNLDVSPSLSHRVPGCWVR